MADFELNPRFLQGLSEGFRIPLDGTEQDAILSLKQQLEAIGLTPDDAGVAKMVHEARSGALPSTAMWEIIQPSGAQTFLRNPSDANRYHVVVRSPTIRNSEHEASFSVVHARAQVKLDTFSAMGVDKTFDITWHDQQDESDDPQNWHTELY